MLPRVQPYQNASSGDANAGLFEDIGTRSLFTVRVGEGAGKISSGSANTFVGYESGKTNSAGSYDTFIGYQAGAQNTGANYSTFIGAFAGRENQRGSDCVMIGYRAGELNRDGQSMVAVGSYAMRENISGTGSVAVGWRAGERNVDGDYNTMVGAECAQDNRSGSMNTMCGFRSGRANFAGNENTYIGAYSGYSNRSGSGNCLVGYKSGERLSFGDCNVAIGAFALQEAENVSFNVAIGPFAGANSRTASENVMIGLNAALSNTEGSRNVVIGVNCGEHNTNGNNVLIGHDAARNSSATETVVIGASAAQQIGGERSVIIGYGTASHLSGGMSNVLIGSGADTYYANVDSSISIGTKNTFTSSYSITVGEEIYNTRAYSILMGFGLQSDANNSVLMGNNINIQSIIFFKDPLNYTLRGSVAADGYNKLGVRSIFYGESNRLLVSATGEYYLNAKAGVVTSNIVNSTDNRPSGNTTYTDFDIVKRLPKPYKAIVTQGRAFPITSLGCNAVIYGSNHLYETWDRGGLPVSPITIDLDDFLYTHTYTIPWMIPSTPVNNLICNVREFPSSIVTHVDIDFYLPKRVATYAIDPVVVNINTHPFDIGDFRDLTTLSNVYSLEDGLTSLPGNLKVFVETLPSNIVLDKAVYSPGETIRYKVPRERLYIAGDSFHICPVMEIAGSYGVVGRGAMVSINFTGTPSSNILTRRTFLNPRDTHVDDYSLIKISDSDFAPGNLPIRVSHLDSNCSLNINGRDYTSNVIDMLIAEGVYTTYSDDAYMGYVRSLSNVATIMYNEYFQEYYSAIRPPINSFIAYSVNNLPQYNTIINVAVPISDSTPAEFPVQYAALSNTIDNWIAANQNNLIQIDIDTILDYRNALITQFNRYPWILSQSAHNNLRDRTNYDTYVTSNEYVGLVQAVNFLEIDAPINNRVGWSNAFLTMKDRISFYNYKYFELPRINATFGDVKLTATADASRALTLDVIDGASTYNVSYEATVGKDYTWYECPFTSCNVSIAHPHSNVIFPAITNAQTVFPAKLPKFGIYDSSSRTYTPYSPFEATDKVVFVATSNDYSQEISWNINYDQYAIISPDIYCSAYNYGFSTDPNMYYSRTLFPAAPSIVTTSPIVDVYNVIVENQITQTTNQYSYSVPSVNYSHSVGYLSQDERITITQSTITESATNGSNSGITYTSNVRKILTSNPPTLFIDSISESENGTDFTYYITITSNIEIYTFRARAKDTFTSNIVSDEYIYYHYDSATSNYVFTAPIVTTPREVPELATRYTQDSASLTMTSNYVYNGKKEWNHRVYEPYQFLNRNIIFSRNSVFHVNSNLFVASNVGTVSSFSQSDIDANRIAIRTSLIAGETDVVQITVNGSNTYNTAIRKFLAENVSVLPSAAATITDDITLLNIPTTELNTAFNIYKNIPAFPFTPELIHVTNCRRGWFKQGTNIPVDVFSYYIYTATDIYDDDFITFYYSSNNVATSPITYNFTINRFSYYATQYFNVGLSTKDETILDPYAFNPRNYNRPIDIVSFDPPNIVVANMTSFTTDDVKANMVKLRFLDTTPRTVTMTYQIGVRSHTFNIIPYVYNSLALVNTQSNTLYISRLGSAIDTSNMYNSNDQTWKLLDTARYQGNLVHASNLFIHIVNPSTVGYLWNTAAETKVAWTFTFDDVKHDRIRFIPYDPDYMPNVALTAYIQWQKVISPPVALNIKNYISTFPTAFCTSRSYRLATINVDGVLKRSRGMTDDGVAWSPGTLSVPSVPSSFVATLSLNNMPYTWDIPLITASYPISFNTNTHTIYLDQADSTALSFILDYVVADLTRIQGMQFYLLTPPTSGWVQNVSPQRKGKAAVVFSDSDVSANHIIYQHNGTNVFADSFQIGISTTPYDLSVSTLTIQVVVRPIAKVVNNKHTYLYYNTPSAALSGRNYFASNLDIDHGGYSAGYIHFVGSNLIKAKNNLGANVATSTVTDFINNNLYYQLDSVSAYDGLYLDVLTNSSSNSGYRNPLIALHSVYRDVFVKRFDVSINKYVSINTRVQSEAQTERIARLRYTFDNSAPGYSNIIDHVFSYYIQIRPTQNLLPSQFTTADGLSATSILRRYTFNMRFMGRGNVSLLDIHFRHTGITVTWGHTNSIHVNNVLTFGLWNNILFVNEDTENGRRGSLYVGYNNKLSRQLNRSKNVFLGSAFPRISMDTLDYIEIVTDIEDPDNFIGTSNIVLSSSAGTLSTSFDIVDYNTQIWLRNQEIYASTYSLDSPDTEVQGLDVHNVVVGKNILVRGINNVCVGNTFNTSGQYSIIIGNDIGTGEESEGQVNELYQCIVIGNRSFQNSLTRDTISIGNNNFNALSTYPQAVVNNFLLQKPIIIGNDIAEDAIDYQINIGNSFLRTNNGGNQLYLGRFGETVCVGYTSNMKFVDGSDFRMRVNGAVIADGYLTSYRSQSQLYVAHKAVYEVDGELIVANDERRTDVIGVIANVGSDADGAYVLVQNRGVAMVDVHTPITRGDLLMTSNINGLAYQGDDFVRNYTVAKALDTVTTVGVQRIKCMLLC